MSDPRAHVALFVDFDSLFRTSLSSASLSGATLPGAPPVPAPAVGATAQALVRFAAGAGRLSLARGYADWSRRSPDDARAADAAHVLPVLAVTGAAGEDRAHLRLAVDALEARFAGGEPDAIVVATGDGTLVPLARALRADGAHVTLVLPAAAAADEWKAESDAVATLEDVLSGAVSPPVAPRPVADAEDDGSGEEPEEPAGARGPHAAKAGAKAGHDGPPRGWTRPTLPVGVIDFTRYEWAPFVRLIDELEHRLPFVGVRYLVNKVLSTRNCGTDDPRQKRDLINRAVDDGLIEMYEVGNVGERRDPVTACRLDRRNAAVTAVLGSETTTPTIPEVRPEEGGPADGDETDALEPSDVDLREEGD